MYILYKSTHTLQYAIIYMVACLYTKQFSTSRNPLALKISHLEPKYNMYKYIMTAAIQASGRYINLFLTSIKINEKKNKVDKMFK